MEYIKLGNTGMDISPLALGCMTYGDPGRGPHPWTLPEEQSRPLIRQAMEAGINFFDTANVYSNGSSEEIIGRALADQQSALPSAIKRMDPFRHHAGPLQPGLPGGGTRNVPALRGPEDRGAAVESASAGEAHPGLGRENQPLGEGRVRQDALHHGGKRQGGRRSRAR